MSFILSRCPRTAALFKHPITRPYPIPDHSELNWGIPISYALVRQTKGEEERQRKETKEKTVRPLVSPKKGNIRKKLQPKVGLARLLTPQSSRRPSRLCPRPFLTWPPLLTPCALPACSPESPEQLLWPPPSTATSAPVPWGAPSGTPFQPFPKASWPVEPRPCTVKRWWRDFLAPLLHHWDPTACTLNIPKHFLLPLRVLVFPQSFGANF